MTREADALFLRFEHAVVQLWAVAPPWAVTPLCDAVVSKSTHKRVLKLVCATETEN